MTNKIELTATEARIIGCLLEKEVATPEQYPLSLNALTLACNQKSNREPVMNLSENEVQETLDSLSKKHLVIQRSGYGSRVAKYHQLFCNSEFGELQFSPQERGIICVMLLRGPQTPGELRTRTNRLCEFADVQEVESVLQNLQNHEKGRFVVKLPREAGKRESRYAQLFCGEVEAAKTAATESESPDRIGALEEQVKQLLQELAEIKNKLDM